MTKMLIEWEKMIQLCNEEFSDVGRDRYPALSVGLEGRISEHAVTTDFGPTSLQVATRRPRCQAHPNSSNPFASATSTSIADHMKVSDTYQLKSPYS